MEESGTGKRCSHGWDCEVATTIRLGDPDPDAGFWLSRPPMERVAHVRELQGCYYGPNSDHGDGCNWGRIARFRLAVCRTRGALPGGSGDTRWPPRPSRLTKDLDIWVWIDPENAKRLAAVLDEFGFESLGLSAEDFAVESQVVQPGYPPNRIDILTSIAGVDFEGCWEQRTEIMLDSMAVPFIGLEGMLNNDDCPWPVAQ